LALMAYLNSPIYDYLVKLTMEKWLQPKFIVSSVKRLPFPTELCIGTQAFLAECSQAVTAQIALAQNFEESRYAMPWANSGHSTIAEITNGLSRNAACANEARVALVEKATQRLYTLFEMSSRDLTQPDVSELSVEADEEPDSSVTLEDSDELGVRLIAFTAGCAFGRWDIRYATGEKAAPELPDPFAALPVCPPGMLQDTEGLPLRKTEVQRLKAERKWDYLIEIPWEGILVDNPGHTLDIEGRVRQGIEIIWKERADAIEHEACEMLDVRSLREYLRKPTAFFADHLKRYSKSRRQAPIYWPLSTASGSYTLWIYYHRLNDQTLFQCVNEFVKPKLEEVRRDMVRLQAKLRDSGTAKERQQLQDLLAELTDFHDELLRVAGLPYKPNLNDGVLINASPLHKLFRLPKWQKDLKTCWDELSRGEYDWAHLAYAIWPDRVRDASKKDRSIAIAHGLEELCEVKAPDVKGKRGRKKQQTALDLEEDEQ
jgi:hypothetical protein